MHCQMSVLSLNQTDCVQNKQGFLLGEPVLEELLQGNFRPVTEKVWQDCADLRQKLLISCRQNLGVYAVCKQVLIH
jgi:hypothetical protein